MCVSVSVFVSFPCSVVFLCVCFLFVCNYAFVLVFVLVFVCVCVCVCACLRACVFVGVSLCA